MTGYGSRTSTFLVVAFCVACGGVEPDASASSASIPVQPIVEPASAVSGGREVEETQAPETEAVPEPSRDPANDHTAGSGVLEAWSIGEETVWQARNLSLEQAREVRRSYLDGQPDRTAFLVEDRANASGESLHDLAVHLTSEHLFGDDGVYQPRRLRGEALPSMSLAEAIAARESEPVFSARRSEFTRAVPHAPANNYLALETDGSWAVIALRGAPRAHAALFASGAELEPRPREFAAALVSWHSRFGAVPLALGYALTFEVARPPRDRATLRALAYEFFLFCPAHPDGTSGWREPAGEIMHRLTQDIWSCHWFVE